MMPEDPSYITIHRNSHCMHSGNIGGSRQVHNNGILVLSYSSLEDDDNHNNHNNNNSNNNTSTSTGTGYNNKNSLAFVAHAPSTINKKSLSNNKRMNRQQHH